MERWQIKQRQAHPLEVKIRLTENRIIQWYEHFHGDVYISFSGGLDSTILLSIAQKIYPKIPVAYVDTGLEFPENREFVKSKKGVVFLKPEMNFKKVIEKYGYPVVSKEQSQFIDEYRNTKSEKLRKIRWDGNKWGRGKIFKKWRYLIDAPFKVSDKCCNVMKKRPAKKFEKETGLKPILGNTAGKVISG